MSTVGQAVNVLVSLAVICAFVHVYSRSDILIEILDWCAVALAMVLLLVLVLQSLMGTFVDFNRQSFHKINVGDYGLNWLLEGLCSQLASLSSCVSNFLGAERISLDLGSSKTMEGSQEAINILVSLTVISAFISVNTDSDALEEIIDCLAVVVAFMLLLVRFLQPQLDTVLDLSSELFHKFVKSSGNRRLWGRPLPHHSCCHCHAIKEASDGFLILKLKHGVAKRICDGVYQVNVQNIGDVIYNVAGRSDSISRISYNLAVACSNEFVLKTLYCFNPNCDQVCYVMEFYEQNFEQWLQENALFDHQGKHLNPDFLQILRDVLRGIGYLHRVKNICHSNLSVLNIVIVNGRAKITGIVSGVLKTNNVDDYLDYLDLATIVRSCFGTKQLHIPAELELFLTYISVTKPSRLLNIENHPIFLSTLQRLYYRVISHTFLYFGNSKKPFISALNKRLRKYKWKHNVGTFCTVLNHHKTLQHLPSKRRKHLQYNQSATSFMRFSRNVVMHLKDNKFNQHAGRSKLSAEEVEEELTGYWPEFMPILHEILVHHGHLMVVHDAVLK
ncbi:hypothetical protein CJ030_MR4G016473 [Morella rubra]|uniref:Protein kinase domain-containing protein n=1 Tax=Morella rubra TaxID=262757 RepID=A0A6A1VVZ8_9ROSI|nr:hypothetical protein CJ030_MR4G016473 [Morella rubra]